MTTTESNTTEEFDIRSASGVVVTCTVDDEPLSAWLDRYVLDNRLVFSLGARWETSKRLTDLPRESVHALWITPYGGQSAVLDVRGLIAYVVLNAGDCRAQVFAQQLVTGDLEAALDQLRTWLEPMKEDRENRVKMSFRFRSCRGLVNSQSRSIEAPAWSDIRANYTRTVQEQIDRLVTGFHPGDGGHLLLLHGAPGTGKTYVVRALARAWRDWCRFEYLSDPEAFFGDAEYMMRSLLESANDDDEDSGWRLLVVEDAGELLSGDAKIRTGQGLSRLLNLGEGLIGQGLRVLFLITTNDDLRTLNKAVARPGRTAAAIEFAPLTAEEANLWLADHGRGELTVGAPATLAELFAMLSGDRIVTRPRDRMGFRRN